MIARFAHNIFTLLGGIESTINKIKIYLFENINTSISNHKIFPLNPDKPKYD